MIHHPLVALIQIDLKLLFPHLFPAAKSLLVAATAVGCCLVSYRMSQRLLCRRQVALEPLNVNTEEPSGGHESAIAAGAAAGAEVAVNPPVHALRRAA